MAQNIIIVAGLNEDGIYISEVPADGLPPDLSTMSFIGEIVPDSVVPEDDEDTEVQIKGQETGKVLATLISEVGTKRLKFATYNYKDENLLLALGGSVSATGTWSEPISLYAGVLKCVAFMSRAMQETGLHELVYLIQTNLKGADEGLRQEGDASKLNFTAVKQAPQNASGAYTPARVVMKIPTAPTNGVVDDTANSFDWDEVPAIVGFAKYEYTIDDGSNWLDCTAKPQTGITGAHPAGEVQVRVKENITTVPKYEAGLALLSTEEFTV